MKKFANNIFSTKISDKMSRLKSHSLCPNSKVPVYDDEGKVERCLVRRAKTQKKTNTNATWNRNQYIKEKQQMRLLGGTRHTCLK